MTRPMVQVFGRPDLCVEGRRRHLRANHAHRLVAYLACRSAWVARDEAIFLFWPDRLDAVGHRNLRKVLHVARRDVGGIEVEGDRIRWLGGSDVRDWREALGRGDAEGALARERGPLLDGLDAGAPVEFASWLEQARREIRSQRVDGVMARCRELQGHDPGASVALALALVMHDPLDDRARHGYWRILASAGRLGALGDAYRAYVRQLDRDLGVAPDEATQTLYRTLASGPHEEDARGDATLAPPAGTVASPVQARVATVPWGRTSFVGRASELAQLDDALASALGGAGGFVVVEGEAGVGKTRLVETFLAGVPTGVAVHRGRCYARDPSEPFEPVRTALAVRDADVGALPAYGARSATSDEDDRIAGRHALAARLVAAAATTLGALLFVDDLQWADAATLDLLAYVAHRVQSERVLVVATYRREDRDLLDTWCERTCEHRTVRTVPLHRFDAAETRGLVAQLVRGDEDDLARYAAYVHGESEGNPYFAIEVVRSLRNAAERVPATGSAIDASSWKRNEDADLPGSIRSLLWARYGSLEREARDVLDAASVIGRRFGFDQLARVAGTSAPSLWAVLEPLLRAGLITTVSDGAYAFAHDKLRQVVHERLGPPSRRALQARNDAATQTVGVDEADAAPRPLATGR
ncbi:MAG: AAA family ATPase [Trueperaceae bacterium]